MNGKAERSHQTDEHEFYRVRRYGTRAHLQRAFARRLWHYNHGRLDTGSEMQGRTPRRSGRSRRTRT